MGQPWYASSAGYFAPYPAYPSAFAWVTDYYLSRTLSDGYQAQSEPPADNFQASDAFQSSDTLQAWADTPITPELKSAIAEEVQQQIAFENAASTGAAPPNTGELPSALTPNHLFVASENLDVTTADQQTCSISPGDLLRLDAAPTDGVPLTNLHVASSKRADCPAGTQISVSLQDLQDMQNNLRADIDSGLEALRSNQGQGGLPPAPPEAVAPPPRPAMAGLPSETNANVASLLDAQRREATKTEAGILKSASP
jgi:hypothetical protein